MREKISHCPFPNRKGCEAVSYYIIFLKVTQVGYRLIHTTIKTQGTRGTQGKRKGDRCEGSRSIAIERAKKSAKKEKEKHEEKQVKKRKSELDQIDMIETKETRIRRNLIDKKPQVPAEASQPTEMHVKEKDEECQPIEPPPRRKMQAKKSKAQQPLAPAHYPFCHTLIRSPV